MKPEAARQGRVVDERVFEAGADVRVVDAALMPVRHALDVHDFLMIGAVVMHDAQERNAVMRRGPKDSGSVHQIAVVLNAYAKSAVLAVSERCADRCRSGVADPRRATATDGSVGPIDVPEAKRPGADRSRAAHQRPVLIANYIPDLGGQARGGNGARVPGIRRGIARLFRRLLMRRG